MTKRGRKKLPPGERKVPLTVLVKKKSYLTAKEECAAIIKKINES